MTSSIKTLHFDQPDRLFESMAAELADIARLAVDRRGVFRLVLNGGSTPVGLFAILRSDPYRSEAFWKSTEFWWGDERCVPPDDPGSNYKLAAEQLLGSLEIEPAAVRRIRGELSPRAAAADYAGVLAAAAEDGRTWPRFDLVLLGLGLDGHTASIFPGSPETDPGVGAIAVTADYQDRPSERVSLTPAAINSARHIFWMVVGEEKAGIVDQVWNGPHDPERIPAHRIRPEEGEMVWWVALKK